MGLNIKEQSDEILSRYSGDKSELIPILQEAQEQFGYLPGEVIRRVAKSLRLPESTVYGIATFYAQFKLTPTGKTIVSVCQGPACHVQEGERILVEVEKQLGIKPGETTDSGKYTLQVDTCSGSCALAPIMVVNGNIYGKMTIAQVKRILADTK